MENKFYLILANFDSSFLRSFLVIKFVAYARKTIGGVAVMITIADQNLKCEIGANLL